MSDDAHSEQAKDSPTGGPPESKPSFRKVLPETVKALLGTDGDETRIEAENESSPQASDDSVATTRPGQLSRRSFVMLASGATVAAAGASFGTASPTTTVTQPDAYGYGGASAGPGGGATTVVAKRATTVTTQTTDNDERANALNISPGTLVETELAADSVDWFTFDAAVDDPITVEYERSASVGVTGLILYDPDGNFVNQLYVGTDTVHQLTSTATMSGGYFLQVIDVEEGDGPYSFTVSVTADDGTTTEQSPYFDSPVAVPGRIQAQNFDNGGQDVAYHDSTTENQGGEYRPDEYVDIELSGDSSNDYNVGYLTADEWLEYTVDVTAGTYTLNARVATEQSGREYDVLVGGELVATLNPPDTGGAWQTVSVTGVDVPNGGTQILRVNVNTDGGDFNWLELVNETDNAYGTQTYGEYGYGG